MRMFIHFFEACSFSVFLLMPTIAYSEVFRSWPTWQDVETYTGDCEGFDEAFVENYGRLVGLIGFAQDTVSGIDGFGGTIVGQLENYNYVLLSNGHGGVATEWINDHDQYPINFYLNYQRARDTLELPTMSDIISLEIVNVLENGYDDMLSDYILWEIDHCSSTTGDCYYDLPSAKLSDIKMETAFSQVLFFHHPQNESKDGVFFGNCLAVC